MTSTTDGVDLTITAADPAATREILSRAHEQVAMGEPTGSVKHDGRHGGPGAIGFCPIVHTNTTITVDDVPGGVLVHVRPLDRSTLEALRTETTTRVEAIASPSS